MSFYYRKSLFKFVFGQNFFSCQPILKMFAAHLRLNEAPNSEEEIICSQLDEIEDIRKIPLSEGSFYTLIFMCNWPLAKAHTFINSISCL